MIEQHVNEQHVNEQPVNEQPVNEQPVNEQHVNGWTFSPTDALFWWTSLRQMFKPLIFSFGSFKSF